MLLYNIHMHMPTYRHTMWKGGTGEKKRQMKEKEATICIRVAWRPGYKITKACEVRRSSAASVTPRVMAARTFACCTAGRGGHRTRKAFLLSPHHLAFSHRLLRLSLQGWGVLQSAAWRFNFWSPVGESS